MARGRSGSRQSRSYNLCGLSFTDIQVPTSISFARLKGEPGEQATLFFLDPSGNAIEFKAFEHIENLFAK